MNIFTLHLRFQNCLSGVAVSLLTSIMDYSRLDSRYVQAKDYYPFCILLIQYLLLL